MAKRFVVQWKCNRWVNFTDGKGNTLYFESINDAREFQKGLKSETRIAEYLGGRKYIATL